MLCQCDAEECTCVAETTSFDAQTHAAHIEQTFESYGVDSKSWLVCQVADNCTLNRCLARVLQVRHVGCSSHKLNLEIEAMALEDNLLFVCTITNN